MNCFRNSRLVVDEDYLKWVHMENEKIMLLILSFLKIVFLKHLGVGNRLESFFRDSNYAFMHRVGSKGYLAGKGFSAIEICELSHYYQFI